MSDLLWTSLYVLGFAASVGASGVISGVETGCYTLNRVRLSLKAGQTPPSATARVLQRELDQPDRLLATLLIGNSVTNYAGALATTALFQSMKLPEATVGVLSSLVLAPALFVVGDCFPKELFRVRADSLTYTFARPLAWLRVVLTATGVLPLIRVLRRSVESVAGLKPETLTDARQRIAQLLKEGAASMSESQVSMLDRALAFRGITVGDEMTAWSGVRSVPVDADHRRALRLIGDVPHMSVPLVDRAGRVAGVIRQIDLFARTDSPLAGLARSPVRLKRTTGVREALVLLRQSESHFGVVEDDGGRPLGIVTPKDLVEPLTGALADL